MLAVALALAASLSYGVADFAGGYAARATPVLRVVAVATPASLALALVLLPLLGASWSAAALAWGAASGVASALSFPLLYRCLALGPMSVLSPVTALTSAVLPVAVGLLLGERLGAAGAAGVGVALVAVVLVSAAPGAPVARPTRAALATALGAGTAIAAQLVLLDAAPATSGLAPLLAGRAVATALVVGVALALGAIGRGDGGRGDGGRGRWLPLAVAAGALDAAANLAFLLAAREGQLAVVAVVTALYPAATLVLARVVLHERLAPAQLLGLAGAAAAVVLLALP